MRVTILTSALSLIALTAPALAQDEPMGLEDMGLEEMAGQFYAPAPGTEGAPVITEDDVEGAGAFALAARMGEVDEALAGCKKMRFQMSALIGESLGSYSVHPSWIEVYQQCLLTRHEEVDIMGDAISKQEKTLIGAYEGEAALRAADVMARLAVYHIQVKNALRRELDEQKSFVSYYNNGGSLEATPDELPPTEVTPSEAKAIKALQIEAD